MTKFLNLTQARSHLPEILDEVEQGNQIIITRHGKPTALLIRIEPEMLETMAILKSKETMKKIRKAKDDIKAGRLHSYEDVFGAQ